MITTTDSPKTEAISRTESLMNEMRKMPLFRQLVPLEAGIGLPMPIRKEGKVYITLPFFGMSSTGEPGKTKLYPPFAIATIDWSNKVPVEYVNLRFRHPAPELNWIEQVGTFPHPGIARMSVGKYKQLRKELLGIYDRLLDLLAQKNPIDPKLSERFIELLNILIEPAFKPYYRALNPKFSDRFIKD